MFEKDRSGPEGLHWDWRWWSDWLGLTLKDAETKRPSLQEKGAAKASRIGAGSRWSGCRSGEGVNDRAEAEGRW